MKIAIRDDDINFFTDPKILETIYADIWDKCPISLSVVPFHACTKSGAIPSDYWQGETVFPIGENRELVSFLKRKIEEGRISITLHGYSHKDNPNGYEFEAGADLSKKIKEGKEYLEGLFNVCVRTFIPPHNTISKEGLQAVIDNRLNLVGLPPFKLNSRGIDYRNIVPYLRLKIFYHKYKFRKYPYVLDFGDHKEVAHYSLTPNVGFKELKGEFDFCHKMDGCFILAVHYWEFDAVSVVDNSFSVKDVFYKFWQYVRNNECIEFVTINDIFED